MAKEIIHYHICQHFDGIHHDVRESAHKVEIMVGQEQLIYCVFITGYIFRPIYRSSSGLLIRESVNVMHVGIPPCLEIKYVKHYVHRMFMLVRYVEVGKAIRPSQLLLI